jgi:phenylacetic acid degradation operon negative regulatory protein
MKPATELFLYHLMWTCGSLARPTLRNVSDSFEAWAYRNGFLRQIQRLERQTLIARETADDGSRLHRLTDAGRLRALGGRDPIACWNRKWDGQWRMVLFDLPLNRNTDRARLRRLLRDRGFGCLQQSVWITPHPLDVERNFCGKGPADVTSLILLEARPCAGETDGEIVAASWEFAEINRRYEKHGEVLSRRPTGPLNSEPAAQRFAAWVAEERAAWMQAIKHDPLLPRTLLPRRYAGCDAWRRRMEVMAEAGHQMRAYTPPASTRQ